MTIRKILLSTMALALLAAPALAQDTLPTPPAGGPAGGPAGMLASADSDGDGQLSKAEFMAIHEKRFAEMDADKDGKISKEEMKAHRDRMKSEFEAKRKEWEQMRKDGKMPTPGAGPATPPPAQ